jgi:hypothetical protein
MLVNNNTLSFFSCFVVVVILFVLNENQLLFHINILGAKNISYILDHDSFIYCPQGSLNELPNPLFNICSASLPRSIMLKVMLCKMVTFHAKGNVELIIPTNEFGISQMTKKYLCVMFGLQPDTIHISKDDAYDDNNGVTRSIYQVPVNVSQGLEWILNGRMFNIVGEKHWKSS